MKKTVIGVLVGYLTWSVLWLLLNAVLGMSLPEARAQFESTQYLGDATYLLALLGCSVACGLAAGRVSASLARPKALQATLIMAILLLITGIGVQASAWSSMPTWYHLSFLALIVPACLLAAPRQSA